ncbi:MULTISPECIES: MerR family DNA-binding transcriptional regulator [unclassified Cryobacterium]|uniref:MerR family DNA-binding transcriptional regulator n=1 Tax=unclassified Cryobacterium TaxID=2649013 RepID=UPI001E516C38|nr:MULTISPECIES: MerR family DNA-binding transcriptional regulator [unclassified Cryobacterium]
MTAKTLRYVEDRGLLPPPERASKGYREYGHDTLSRLSFRRARDSCRLPSRRRCGRPHRMRS